MQLHIWQFLSSCSKMCWKLPLVFLDCPSPPCAVYSAACLNRRPVKCGYSRHQQEILEGKGSEGVFILPALSLQGPSGKLHPPRTSPTPLRRASPHSNSVSRFQKSPLFFQDLGAEGRMEQLPPPLLTLRGALHLFLLHFLKQLLY